MGYVVTDLVSKFNAVYQDEGQNFQSIKKQLFEAERTDMFFRAIPTSNDIYKSSYGTIGSVLQAFSIPFNKKGDVSFNGNSVELGEFKIDADFSPDVFRNTFQGFLAELEEPQRKNWSVIRWGLMEMLIPKSKEEYEEDVTWRGWKFNGTYAATPTVNGTTFVRQLKSESTANPANATMDGIWVQILKNLSRVNVINTGAIEAVDADFCEQIEDFVQGIDAPLRARIDYIFMSEALYNKYKDGRRAKYNLNYLAEQDLTAINNSNIRVEWMRGMDGSSKIWGTPAMNRVRPTHTENSGRFDIQANGRVVDVLTDWKKVIAFDVPEYVVTNDLENTITAQNITDYYTEA